MSTVLRQERTAITAPTRADGAPPRRRLLVLLYVLTAFSGSSLLFLIEPMFAKMVLPLLGGTPAVWNTAVLFFQIALLAGYAYAHWATQRLSLRRHLVVHALLVLLPIALLPIAIPEGWRPPTAGSPALWLLGLMVVAIGLPFFVISTAGPLLQRWFANSGHPSAHDPYFLYRASNLGSMLALLGYPVLLEPAADLTGQATFWSWGYFAFAALTLLSGYALWRRAPRRQVAAASTAPSRRDEDEPRPALRRRLWWVLLAFVPSSFMLGVTTHLTTDIAAIPLLWVVPLALYLLTFIAAFGTREARLLKLAIRAQPFVLLPLLLIVALRANRPAGVVIGFNFAAFFVSALVCHLRLSSDRPSARHLTEFYIWLAVGGMLGGAFNTLVAPLIFSGVTEYSLALVLVCLLRPGAAGSRRSRRLDLLLPAVLFAAYVGAVTLAGSGDYDYGWVVACVAVVALFAFAERPMRFGLSVGALLLATNLTAGAGMDVLLAERTFFGVHRVVEQDGFHKLAHGNTIHGLQNTDPAERREPLTYYYRTGPIGQVFSTLPAARADRVGVVGLGAGSLACYATPGQRWTFYEIDPVVERFARDPSKFSYLSDCLPDYDVVLGDARLSVADAPDGIFDLLVLDAFTSDTVPVHLITREAFELYLSKLAPGGVIAVHISNRYLDLEPVIGALAEAEHLAALHRSDRVIPQSEADAGKVSSSWMVLSADPEALQSLSAVEGWEKPTADGEVWTDGYSNVLSVFRWR